MLVIPLFFLAIVSTVFGMMMAVSHELPSLENAAEFRAARNSTLLAAARRRPADRAPDRQQQPHPRRGRGHLAVHQERDHRDRGPPLLLARRRRLPGHRPRALPGRRRARRRPGRVDDHPAVRQERAGRPGRPLGLPEAARGGAGLPPRTALVEAEDPDPVPEHDLLRQRRLRRRVRGAHLLRRPRPRVRAERPRRALGHPGPGRDAGRDDRVAEPVRPGPEPTAGIRAAQHRAPADARAEDDQPGSVRHGDQADDPDARATSTSRSPTRRSRTTRPG